MVVTVCAIPQLLDKLFQLRTQQGEQSKLSDNAITCLKQKVIIVFGGSYGIGGEIINIAKQYNSHIYSFSRSLSPTEGASDYRLYWGCNKENRAANPKSRISF